MKKNIMIACGGALLGAVAAYILVKKKYETVIDSLSDQVNDFVGNDDDAVVPIDDNIVVVDPEMDKTKIKKPSYDTDYEETLDNTGYNDMFKEKPKPATKKTTKKKKPQDIEYIDPITFGDDKDYDTLTFTYYADNVVANEDNEELAEYEIEAMLGKFEDHFGEYEQDSVNVKNNKTKTYYEILKDDRCYSEIND